MSDMSDPREARSWVQDNKNHYRDRAGGPVYLARELRRAATEQRANLKRSERCGWGGSKGRAAYLESVEMLEREADAAETAAEAWSAAEETRKGLEAEEAARLETERLAALEKRFPGGWPGGTR